MTSDFAHYLHLQRVRTLIQILTPRLEAGSSVYVLTVLSQLRKNPDPEKHSIGASRLAIEYASFERMSDKEMHRVVAAVIEGFRRYYGPRLSDWSSLPTWLQECAPEEKSYVRLETKPASR